MLNESRTRATAAGIVIGIAAASSRLGSIDSSRQPTTRRWLRGVYVCGGRYPQREPWMAPAGYLFGTCGRRRDERRRDGRRNERRDERRDGLFGPRCARAWDPMGPLPMACGCGWSGRALGLRTHGRHPASAASASAASAAAARAPRPWDPFPLGRAAPVLTTGRLCRAAVVPQVPRVDQAGRPAPRMVRQEASGRRARERARAYLFVTIFLLSACV